MSLDLSTNFGGLKLRSPIIVGSCPLTANTQNRIAMESSGAGAVVLPSLLEEHVIAWRIRKGGSATQREQHLIARYVDTAKHMLELSIHTNWGRPTEASVLQCDFSVRCTFRELCRNAVKRLR